MAGRIRLTTDPVPTIWLVSPRGKPFKHPVGQCFNSKLIKLDGGRPVLRAGAIDLGYRYLNDLLASDEVAGWQEFSKAEAKAKGRLRLPPQLLPRALRNRDTSRPGPRVFVPSAELSAAMKRADHAPATAPAVTSGVDLRDIEIEQLRAQLDEQRAALALALEEKTLLEQIAAEQETSAEIESRTIAPKVAEPKAAEPKAESKPAKKAEQKGDAI